MSLLASRLQTAVPAAEADATSLAVSKDIAAQVTIPSSVSNFNTQLYGQVFANELVYSDLVYAADQRATISTINFRCKFLGPQNQAGNPGQVYSNPLDLSLASSQQLWTVRGIGMFVLQKALEGLGTISLLKPADNGNQLTPVYSVPNRIIYYTNIILSGQQAMFFDCGRKDGNEGQIVMDAGDRIMFLAAVTTNVETAYNTGATNPNVIGLLYNFLVSFDIDQPNLSFTGKPTSAIGPISAGGMVRGALGSY